MEEKEQILEEISGFLHTYLKSGQLGFRSFLSKINMNIQQIEQLLVIRFLLQKETKQYVRSLPTLLRQFKTTTALKSVTNVGEVRGAINWSETLKFRLNQNYKDRLTFITEESIRSYLTPENLILKELLSILYAASLQNSERFKKAAWFKDWQELKPTLKQVLQQNIYLRRVPVGQVSDRMIVKVKHHRNPLYSQAANLLEQYRRFQRGQFSETELKSLLQETFITPENEDVLFELYWIVQLIQCNTRDSQLHLLDDRENLVASWQDDDYNYAIFHDSAGSSDIQFSIATAELANSDHPYLTRVYESFQMANEYIKNYFNQRTDSTFWRGRPDFIVEIRSRLSKELVRLIIGEVKHTTNKNYAATGLRELFDYMYLVKNDKNEYLSENILVEGILCVGEMNLKQQKDRNRQIWLVNRDNLNNLLLKHP